MTMASSPSLRTVIAAVVAPLATSMRMGLTWNEPAETPAAARHSARAIQGARAAVTIDFMRKGQPSCAAWVDEVRSLPSRRRCRHRNPCSHPVRPGWSRTRCS